MRKALTLPSIRKTIDLIKILEVVDLLATQKRNKYL
jgi:hypothetical protein